MSSYQQRPFFRVTLTDLDDRRFSIKDTHIVPHSYINDPLVWEDIARRDDRCRRSGGIGCVVVLVMCGEVSQVMPIEVDAPTKISWDVRDDWEDVLDHFVSSGRTDFAPISTTSRGYVKYFTQVSQGHGCLFLSSLESFSDKLFCVHPEIPS